MRFDTPYSVARVLARHSCRNAKNVLEPSIGVGALIKPFISRLRRTKCRVTAVDLDEASLKIAFESLEGIKCDTVHGDFWMWSKQVASARFDMVLMNPPFVARKESLLRLRLSDELGLPDKRERAVPVEIAFILRAIRLLKANGRLLAVVPCSLISSERMAWVRAAIATVGSIKYVHEMPHGAFPGLESRPYLFVFEKGRQTAMITLQNHDLERPHCHTLHAKHAKAGGRLDFGYIDALRRVDRLQSSQHLGWTAVCKLANVARGTVDSPIKLGAAIHTTNCVNGLWSDEHQLIRRYRKICASLVQAGDLLVRRVGKGSDHSFGSGMALEGCRCTDCVLMLRPFATSNSLSLLFAIRTMVRVPGMSALLMKGTGAPYISEGDLRRFVVPTRLSLVFPKLFASYLRAVCGGDSVEMCRLETIAATRLDCENDS